MIQCCISYMRYAFRCFFEPTGKKKANPGCHPRSLQLGIPASSVGSTTGSAAWASPSTSISTRIHAQRSAAPISLCDLCAKFCHTALIRSVTIVNPSEDARGKRHKTHPPMNAKVLCVNRCSMILRSRIPMDQNPHKPFVAVINAYECCF